MYGDGRRKALIWILVFGLSVMIGATTRGLGMNQSELQLMANERMLDAAALIAGNRWAYAYYVAGYAVECALKSCVLSRMIHTGGIFTDKKFSEKCWTHDFGELVELAGLKPELNQQLANSPAFAGNWGTTATWKETSRYEQKTEPEARLLYEAINHNSDGVLKWIRNYW